MITIQPFRGIRPTREKVNLVPSRSYMSYTKQELAERLQKNPYSFLRIINPDYESKNPLKGNKKFLAVRNAFTDFGRDGVFIRDADPVFYLYQQRTASANFMGIIAGASVRDYQENRILKHENTITKREKMFRDYLEITGFNAEPVLLAHRDDAALEDLYIRISNQRPEYEFTSTNRDVHKLWIINNPADIQQIQTAFKGFDKVYIADGHHRSASSALLGQAHHGTNRPECFFMAYFIPEHQLQILEFNRLVKAREDLQPPKILANLKAQGTVTVVKDKLFKPRHKGEISMYMAGKWYAFQPHSKFLNAQHPVKSLDAHVLSEAILEPVFQIKDLRKDPAISFLPGDSGPGGIKQAVDTGTFVAGFGLMPVLMDEMKAVADAGLTMPPKSTYINPKLRSGLIIYDFDNHEF